nr:MAG TPA: DNA mismatch endonuclease [Caudoviricetes sp.]
MEKTFGELYKKTMDKIKDLKSQGYNVVYVWENDVNPR